MERQKFNKLRNKIKKVTLGHFFHVTRDSSILITKAELEGFVKFQLGPNSEDCVVNGCVKFIEQDKRWGRLRA